MTLLEVLVAMVILSVGIAGAMQAVSACVLASKAAENYTMAASLAHQALSELARTPELEAGDYEGTFEEPNTDFDWQADVLAENGDGLLPVRVTVLWGPEAKRSHFELRTYLSTDDASTEMSDDSSSGGPS